MLNFIDDITQRGLLHSITEGTKEQLSKECTSGYIGFDPTADSLHIGSLLPITLLMRFQQAGHKPYVLMGGATGMIGDPSGKSAERNLLDKNIIEKNCLNIHNQLQKYLDFNDNLPNAAVLVNNYEWFKNFTFLDFIRDVGKHITLNYMMAKESVKIRMETGISFTEFSYQLLQGYDFHHLHKYHNVKLQMGGADQWGNILTGSELIRRKSGEESYGIVSPLIIKSDGSKFGKTESGNIWLDPARTSPYRFYQYWLNLTDDDASRMIFTFSFKSIEDIKDIIAKHLSTPHLRLLQKAIAEEMTILVHGHDELVIVKQSSEILFGQNSVNMLNSNNIKNILEGIPEVYIPEENIVNGIDVITFLNTTKICTSKSDARRLIQNNGISINKQKITEINYIITQNNLIDNKYILIQKSKKDYFLCIIL